MYGVAFCPISRAADLKALGFMDSKALNDSTRENLLVSLQNCGFIGYKSDVIEPEVISASMLMPKKHSLNAMSFESAIGLVTHFIEKGALRFLI